MDPRCPIQYPPARCRFALFHNRCRRSEHLVMSSFDRLPTFRCFKMPMLEESHRILVHTPVVHKEAMQHGQQAKIARTRQSCAFDRNHTIIIAWKQWIEPLAIRFAASEHSEFKVWCREFGFQLLPSSSQGLGSWPSH